MGLLKSEYNSVKKNQVLVSKICNRMPRFPLFRSFACCFPRWNQPDILNQRRHFQSGHHLAVLCSDAQRMHFRSGRLKPCETSTQIHPRDFQVRFPVALHSLRHRCSWWHVVGHGLPQEPCPTSRPCDVSRASRPV